MEKNDELKANGESSSHKFNLIMNYEKEICGKSIPIKYSYSNNSKCNQKNMKIVNESINQRARLKSFEINSFTNENEYVLYIKIRLKHREIFEFFKANLLYFIFPFSIVIICILIFLMQFRKTKLFLDIIFGGKIYYKNEKNLNLKNIKKQIKNYKKLKIHFDNNDDFVKCEKPKISLIMTVYNQENFIKYIYSSIINQQLKEIEIIVIDDHSTDNSSKIINKFMEKDKRIIYMKNKVNKGAFYSRNKGVLISKGEYILIIDPDDLLLNEILKKSYEIANYYNLDIVQYYSIKGSYNKNKIWTKNKYKSGILYSHEVKDVFFYSISRTLWDKLIKKEVFVKGINFMRKEFQREKYFIHSDDTVLWGIISSATSYGFMEQIGYFYNYENPNSTVHLYYNPKFMNIIFRSLFATLNYYYEQTEENELEKNFVGYKFFFEKIFPYYLNLTDNLTKGFGFIIKVLNKYINCSFFNQTQRMNLTKFRNLIIKRKIKSKSKKLIH